MTWPPAIGGIRALDRYEPRARSKLKSAISRGVGAQAWYHCNRYVFFHLYVIYSFDAAISKFRERLDWIYRTYFSGEERNNLKLFELRSPVDGVTLGLILVSFLGLLLTAIFLWSVR